MTQDQISHNFDGQFSSIQNILVPVSMKTTNMKKYQLSGPFIEANMQMSGRKAEKALTLPEPQQVTTPKQGQTLYLGPVKTNSPVSRERLCFLLCKIKQMSD